MLSAAIAGVGLLFYKSPLKNQLFYGFLFLVQRKCAGTVDIVLVGGLFSNISFFKSGEVVLITRQPGKVFFILLLDAEGVYKEQRKTCTFLASLSLLLRSGRDISEMLVNHFHQ